jgi:hypothetical protein
MAIWDDWIKNRIQGEINDLLKADGVETPTQAATPDAMRGNFSADSLPDQPETGHDPAGLIGRKSIVDDPYFDNFGQQYNYKLKQSRLTNRTLKEVSMRDWLISAIIQCRVDTLLQFSRPSHDRHQMGFRFSKWNDLEEYTDSDRQEISALEDFIYNCGRKENTPHDDKMLFGEFLKLAGRDVVTFGHVAIEKIKTRGGGLHRMRLLPGESVYRINKAVPRKQIESEEASARKVYGVPKGDNDPRQDVKINEVPIEYYKYVQVSYDNRPIANFGDEDMIFKLFNPQNFADSNGYCYSAVEMAIINITNHLNVENYNSNFFTQGYAARGVLHLKGTVTQASLANFRRQFYNSISGTQHAWRTPIVAGLDEVQWVPMSASAKEMEYINFNNHLMRIICAQFQIDPVEIGLDYLVSATGRSPMQQSNNEYKISYSRERGLGPILMFFEDLINGEIVPAIDKNLAAKYKFNFTGFTDETPQTEIAQMQAEMTVYKSMNDLLTQAQRSKIKTPAGDLPMNQAFWVLVEKNMTKGEIRETFFGDKGASERRELAYFPADPLFLTWQQNLLAIDNAKVQRKQMADQASQQNQATQAESEAEAKQKELDNKHAESKHGREGEKHDMEMEKLHAEAAANAVAAGGSGNALQDSAKQFGASKATNAGGTVLANPLNKSDQE